MSELKYPIFSVGAPITDDQKFVTTPRKSGEYILKTKKKVKENRKYQRYIINGAYAAIQPAAVKLGPIIDISMGGVLFKYIIRGKLENKFPEKSIYLGSLKSFVDGILFKTIDDFQESNGPLSKSMEIRTNRIKFEALSSNQRFELNSFICKNVGETSLF